MRFNSFRAAQREAGGEYAGIFDDLQRELRGQMKWALQGVSVVV